MIIRSMMINDVKDVVKLEEKLFTSSWTVQDFEYEINTNPFANYYVLEDHQIIIGYIGLWLLGDQSQITTIGIDPDFQGHGYSHLLLKHVIEITKEKKYGNINLEVRVSNKKAIHLYEKYGFKIEAIRKNYYQDNHEDAYLMMKEMEE